MFSFIGLNQPASSRYVGDCRVFACVVEFSFQSNAKFSESVGLDSSRLQKERESGLPWRGNLSKSISSYLGRFLLNRLRYSGTVRCSYFFFLVSWTYVRCRLSALLLLQSDSNLVLSAYFRCGPFFETGLPHLQIIWLTCPNRPLLML